MILFYEISSYDWNANNSISYNYPMVSHIRVGGIMIYGGRDIHCLHLLYDMIGLTFNNISLLCTFTVSIYQCIMTHSNLSYTIEHLASMTHGIYSLSRIMS